MLSIDFCFKHHKDLVAMLTNPILFLTGVCQPEVVYDSSPGKLN